ncbi:CDP-alcohol phosphatidyltransferase family protein [Candidatus Uhrbacteria bacterium]|nr:CDP-alcohol phosphatidyltransferase family protein [Candidatus Uhrbacteria bacterium]
MKPLPALRVVRSSYNYSLAQPLFFRYVVRPVSFYATYPFLWLRMTANQVTFLGFLVGIASIILFSKGTPFHLAWGVICYALFLVLDFVDGNIARLNDSATYYGHYLDGVADTLVETLLPLAFSIGFFRTTGSTAFLYAGILVSIFLLFSSFVFTRLSFFNRWVDDQLRKTDPQGGLQCELNPLKTKRFPLNPVVYATIDLKIIGILLVGVFGLTAWFLVFILAVTIVHLVPLIIIPLLDAADNLNVRQISERDPRSKQH